MVRFTESTLRHARIRVKARTIVGKKKCQSSSSQRSPYAIWNSRIGPTKRLNDSSDVPKARLGTLPKTYTSSKKKTRLQSTFSRKSGSSPLRKQKSRTEREFVVDSGGCMLVVSKKDFDSAELETVRTSRSPTTVLTANGEVQTRNEATGTRQAIGIFRQWLCFFKKLPQWFPWWNSVRTMGIHTTGSAVENHISSEMAKELITICRTMYHSWFLEFQRVLPQQGLHLPRHHLHHRSQHRLTEIFSIRKQRCWNSVSERSKSTSGEPRRDPLHESTETENKNKNWRTRRKYKDIYRMNCLLGYRNSGRIWSMKVLQQSFGETQSKEVKTLPTLPSHLMNFQWSREQKWYRVRVSTVYILTSRRTQIVISAWRRKLQGLLAEDVLVQSCPEPEILWTW